MIENAPDWLPGLFNDFRSFFMISPAWDIAVAVAKRESEHGALEAAGQCVANPSAMVADIEINSTRINEKDRTTKTIVHELMHLLHSDIDNIVNLVLEDAPQAELLRMLYISTLEKFVSHMTAVIMKNLRGVDEMARGER